MAASGASEPPSCWLAEGAAAALRWRRQSSSAASRASASAAAPPAAPPAMAAVLAAGGDAGVGGGAGPAALAPVPGLPSHCLFSRSVSIHAQPSSSAPVSQVNGRKLERCKMRLASRTTTPTRCIEARSSGSTRITLCHMGAICKVQLLRHSELIYTPMYAMTYEALPSQDS